MKLYNLSNDILIADNVDQAYSFFKRLKGLMFTSKLDSGAGLHIKPCPSVHTFYMKYAIDILYIDRHNTIVAIDEALEPGKVGKHYANAHSVVELPVGTAKGTATKVGHKLNFN